ncbi:histidinol dehydrogenase [Salipaludibacillus agaradhaerens]|uniref:Histidinol dehydrogenase n=1 Tax=Salipaludibacillus agaradhaerens TaxID=76935 RepID=A0A9Q4AYV0_SALAG|nr:histidinol dehydrogenase [Salipaludibacillus agaradhaerens]MCR6095138.1 histidinol dehydrogenase [Salipaludibacillus agaradhaerens]MCR6115304.1 histidinol dehydrogenase [Salipaludibacillus agaradhaerens]
MKIIPLKETVSLKRAINQGTDKQRQTVAAILEDVKKKGDEALQKYTFMFDKVEITDTLVSPEEISEAYDAVSQDTLNIIREAINNIRDFHARQVQQSWMTTKEDGTILGQKVTSLDAVGVYVPGGRAAYPSSIIMNVVPAQVAGVKRIVMTSPPQKNNTLDNIVLVTAHELGVKEIHKVGGAQAIGALAYGTDSIQPVDKIVGPGNIYVALAKQLVFGVVAIDMIAGPSEIAVLADRTANSAYIAADLLSQAEHDPMATAILVTTDHSLAEKVAQEVSEQLATLPKKAIAEEAIQHYGAIYLAETMEQAVEAVNELAAEHLEIQTEDPWAILPSIRHAGAIFLGEHSSEPVGDYFAGPNHVLPTNGTARFSSPLTVEDFTKKSSIISYSKQAIQSQASKIATFARLEHLEAHARAVEKRLED